MSLSATDIRNIAIIGHSGEGKTTLCEAMLLNGRTISRMGRVENGTTVSDFDEQEIARKMSVSLSVMHTYWRETKINLLDVPGFLDFEGELNEAMRACGAALIVMGPTGGVTVGTEKAVSLCMKSDKPMVIFINGMDKDNADYHGTVEALRAAYPAKIAPIQLPIMKDGKMVGIINALTEKAYRFSQTGAEEIPIPDDMKDELDQMENALIETAAENDDVLLEKYFEKGGLSREDTIYGIRKGIANMNVIPVMAGSALNNRGVINLMTEIVKYVPQAAERRDILATDVATGKVINVECDESAPVAAQVFKTTVDPFVGKLNYLRVNRGVLKAGTTLYNPNTGTAERIAALYVTVGKKQIAVNELTAGDIGAVAKLANTGTGDTLCEESAQVKFDPIPFPRPSLYMAVYAKTQGTEDKVFSGLARLAEEDKSFIVTKAGETGESLIGGQGEVHLDVICKKLKSKFGADAVLLITALLDAGELKEYLAIAQSLGLEALTEVHDEAELAAALNAGAEIIGVNNRNLRDFTVDLTTSIRLKKLVPPGITFVAESGIKNRSDVAQLEAAGADAVLIGETLMRSGNVRATLAQLAGERHG